MMSYTISDQWQLGNVGWIWNKIVLVYRIQMWYIKFSSPGIHTALSIVCMPIWGDSHQKVCLLEWEIIWKSYPINFRPFNTGQLDTGQASADHTGAGPLSPPDQVPPAVQSTRVDHMASCVQGHGMHGVDKPHFHVINGSSCVQIGDSCTCVSINISNDLVQYVKSQGILTGNA